MKKAFILAGTLAAALFVSVGFGACSTGGNYSETFKGVVSEETYDSAEKAAEAFFAEEIAEESPGQYTVSYEKGTDLTAEEIAALELGDLKAEDVKTAEHGTVSYTLSTESASLYAAAPQNKGKQVSVIILGLGEDAFRYYIPQPGVGEMISQSYLNSVCDPSFYKNFTLTAKSTTSMNEKVSMQGQSQSIKYSINLSITLKVTETAAFIETTTSASGTLPEGASTPQGKQTVTVYVVVENEQLVAYVKGEGGTYTRNEYMFSEYDSLSELFTYQQPELDYTLFEKTKTGFKLSSDKFDEYVEEYLGDIFNGFGGINVSGEATYFVTEGRLAKGTAKVSAKGGASEDGMSFSVSIGASATSNYTAFGSTVVTLPAEIAGSAS